MKKHVMKLVKGLLPLSVVFAAMAGAASAEVKDRTLRFSFVQPKESHMGYGVQVFSDLVAKKSDGKIKVKMFPGGTLGGDLQTVSALQGGMIDMTTLPPGLLVGLSKEFVTFDLPFLFDSYEEADAVLDGPVGKKLLEKAPAGLVGLAYWDHGFRNITNSKHAIAKADDFKGLKIRVSQSPMIVDTISGLGANAMPMSFTEVYTALEQRAIDGQENPSSVIWSNKFYEVQKHVSTTRHQYNPLIVLISAKTWETLSPEERRILTEASEETRAPQRKVSREMADKALQDIRAAGLTVTEIAPEERAKMREMLRPVTEKYATEAGPELVSSFQEAIGKARGGK